MTINEIQKLTMLYQSGAILEQKTDELKHLLSKDSLKRLRTALTNLDVAIANEMHRLDDVDKRHFVYINNGHETMMAPTKEQRKHIKKLGEIQSLYKIRSELIGTKCSKCHRHPENCRLYALLNGAGTPSWYDYAHLDKLPETELKLANHCKYCGGFKYGQVPKKPRPDSENSGASNILSSKS